MERDYLLDNLLDYPENRENFALLLRTFDKSTFLAFLGTGLGCALRDIPKTEELYKGLRDKYCLTAPETGSKPDDFSFVYQRCESKKEFDRTVFEMVRPKDTFWTAAHYGIIEAFACFVTLNYYDPIEKAFRATHNQTELKRYIFQYPLLINRPDKNTITYLHGNSEIGVCVLRKEDYDYFYPSVSGSKSGIYVLENSLEYIFSNKNIVFWGCSLEEHLFKSFQRFVVNRRRDAQSSSGTKPEANHYTIRSARFLSLDKTETDEATHRQNLEKISAYYASMREINVRPILYVGERSFNEILCERLAKRSKISIDEKTDFSRTGD